MSAASARRGFTLIEVVGAVAAFTIAFLAGSAAFARLLQQQTVNYQRTLASAAAMLLTDWHVDAGAGDFLSHTAGGSNPLSAVTPGSRTTFKGADYIIGDGVYVFNQTASGVDLGIYGSLIITVSDPSATEADSNMTWRQITAWYGSPAAMQANRPCSLEYVGRYLIPDEVK